MGAVSPKSKFQGYSAGILEIGDTAPFFHQLQRMSDSSIGRIVPPAVGPSGGTMFVTVGAAR